MTDVFYTLEKVNQALHRCLSNKRLCEVTLNEDGNYNAYFRPQGCGLEESSADDAVVIEICGPWTTGGEELEHCQFNLRHIPPGKYSIDPTPEELAGLVNLHGKELLSAQAKDDGTLRLRFDGHFWLVVEVDPINYSDETHSWFVRMFPKQSAPADVAIFVLGGLGPEVRIIDKKDLSRLGDKT